MKKNDFEIMNNLPKECQDSSIKQSDFELIDSNSMVHEQKFETKPTTFFKDCVRRFRKNKSSVVAAIILGLLLVLSVAIPIIDTNDIKSPHPESTYLEPKLFNAGLGFWDGTKKCEQIPVDTGENGFNETDREKNWWPNPENFKQNAVFKKKFSEVEYTSGQSKYGKEGYINFGYFASIHDDEEYIEFKTRPITSRVNGDDNTKLKLNAGDKIYLNTFDTYDLNKIKELEGDKEGVSFPEGYELAPVSLHFVYEVKVGDEVTPKDIEILPEQDVFNIGSKVASKAEAAVDVTNIIRSQTSETEFLNAQFVVRLRNLKNYKNTCALIRSIEFDAQLSDADFEKAVEIVNFTDATKCVTEPINETGTAIKNRAYWISTGNKNIHMSKIVYCDFVYDTYEAAYGNMEYISFPVKKLEEYAKKGYIVWKVDSEDDPYTGLYHMTANSEYKVLNKDKSPVVEFKNVEVDELTGKIYADVMLSYYKYYGFERMPRYLMGTDKSGRDMLKYVFEGLRSSLLLGIMTFAICFSFGLLYGSVSGYFGGTVDLVLERITDILAGVPWIVVMTLVIIKAGKSTFGVLLLALCMTGWIGTAATTRTQFYRFRGREYVLASRTLGASDARLIAKHILPNAMGTIITGAVLMIPSVIFSEATISYLGLGFKNLSSLGVILSSNQGELTTNSYLLIFPAVIIALLMISFNLFGNGLRDAVNPSLKGEDE